MGTLTRRSDSSSQVSSNKPQHPEGASCFSYCYSPFSGGAGAGHASPASSCRFVPLIHIRPQQPLVLIHLHFLKEKKNTTWHSGNCLDKNALFISRNLGDWNLLSRVTDGFFSFTNSSLNILCLTSVWSHPSWCLAMVTLQIFFSRLLLFCSPPPETDWFGNSPSSLSSGIKFTLFSPHLTHSGFL